MNCDDFLAALETGGLLRRIQARRHAARCPSCATVQAAFVSAKDRLAKPEPLSPQARAAWERATFEDMRRPMPRRRWVPVAASLATAACLTIVFLSTPVREGPIKEAVEKSGEHPVARSVDDLTTALTDPVEELSQLATAAERLDAELASLRDQVERKNIQREVAVVLESYGRW